MKEKGMQEMLKYLTGNVLGFTLILSIVSGCASREQPIEISTSPVKKPRLELPAPDRIITRPVEWIVITPDNYDAIIEELRNNNQSIALFAVTANGYENISLNLNDIRTYIQQQKVIIAAYERYYQESSAAIDAANSQLTQ
jgi:hypothetical protein